MHFRSFLEIEHRLGKFKWKNKIKISFKKIDCTLILQLTNYKKYHSTVWHILSTIIWRYKIAAMACFKNHYHCSSQIKWRPEIIDKLPLKMSVQCKHLVTKCSMFFFFNAFLLNVQKAQHIFNTLWIQDSNKSAKVKQCFTKCLTRWKFYETVNEKQMDIKHR